MVKGLDCLGIVSNAAGPSAGVGLGGECLGFEDDAVTADDFLVAGTFGCGLNLGDGGHIEPPVCTCNGEVPVTVPLPCAPHFLTQLARFFLP